MLRGCLGPLRSLPSSAEGAAPPSKAAALKPRRQRSQRLNQLYEVTVEDGWSVQVAPSSQSSEAGPVVAKPMHHASQAPMQHVATGNKKQRTRHVPSADITSEQGMLSLALLQQKLLAEGKVGQKTKSGNKLARRTETHPQGLTGISQRGAAGVSGSDDPSEQPAFQLTLGDEGAEFIEYDARGKVLQRKSQTPSSLQQTSLDDDDEFDFTDEQSGWQELAEQRFDDDEDYKSAQSAVTDMEQLLSSASATAGGMLDAEEEEDWGLDELEHRLQPLSEVLGISCRQEDSNDLGVHVQWGGSGGASNVDMEQQEAILSRFFKPHKVRQYMAHQRAAMEEAAALRRRAAGHLQTDAKLHLQLRIISGTAANKKLLSSKGQQTRPMMEKVRAAIFNMIQCQAGSVNELPPGSRWLDLFAGTGSVGLEALSRGSKECHFVEMDPWVTRNVLGKNIATCCFQRQAVVHTFKAEDFLRKAIQLPRFAGGVFDFISVCPPYLLVSYPELFSLLEQSPLISSQTIMFVEYPKQLKSQIPDSVGPLARVKDKKYGRTYIAVYAAAGNDSTL